MNPELQTLFQKGGFPHPLPSIRFSPKAPSPGRRQCHHVYMAGRGRGGLPAVLDFRARYRAAL